MPTIQTRVMIQLRPEVAEALRVAAEADGRSMSNYCGRVLNGHAERLRVAETKYPEHASRAWELNEGAADERGAPGGHALPRPEAGRSKPAPLQKKKAGGGAG